MDGNKFGYGVGASYHLKKSFSFDLAWSQSFLGTRNIRNSELKQLQVPIDLDPAALLQGEKLSTDIVRGEVVGNGDITATISMISGITCSASTRSASGSRGLGLANVLFVGNKRHGPLGQGGNGQAGVHAQVASDHEPSITEVRWPCAILSIDHPIFRVVPITAQDVRVVGTSNSTSVTELTGTPSSLSAIRLAALLAAGMYRGTFEP